MPARGRRQSPGRAGNSISERSREGISHDRPKNGEGNREEEGAREGCSTANHDPKGTVNAKMLDVSSGE